jgi:aspartate/methionine/tyrosine aminotransferase
MSHILTAEHWAPYMAWAKHHPPCELDLCGSNLLHCTVDDVPGLAESIELSARNDDGYPPLVDAIARRFGVETDRVATATGAAGACFLTLGALIRPGDRVLAEWPGYDPHIGAARFLGAEVEILPRSWDEGFRLDADVMAQKIHTGIKAVIVTNLHNPSGVYADPTVLADIADMAEKVGTTVIVDEVYLEAAFDEETPPAAAIHDAFVSINSLTKSFGLAGLRVGWALAEPETVQRIRRVRDVVDAVGAVPAEHMGSLAFAHIDQLLERARRILEPNSRMLRDFVESREELEWVPPPPGAPIGFPRLRDTEDAEDFVHMARVEFGVGVVPGDLFGAPSHFRVSVSGDGGVVEEGLDALGRALDKGL